jgi:hypothetical protein
MAYSFLQRSVSVGSRAEVVTTQAPSTSDACETHAQSVEKIASLATFGSVGEDESVTNPQSGI